MIPPHRIQLEKAPFYYPYRKTCAINVLQNYKCEKELSDEIKILFLGCDDLRNTLKTVTSGNVQHFQLHINHYCPTTLARNILVLKIISSQDFDVKKEEDLAFLWDVWYNVDWPEQTQKRFKLVLKELLDNNLPENVTIVKDSHFEKLRAVWLSWWLAACLNDLKTQSGREKLLKEIHKERLNSIVESWRKLHYKDLNPLGLYGTSAIPEAVDNMTYHLVNKCEDFSESTRKKVHEEVRLFFSKGSCRLRNGILKSAFVNPTMMLDPTNYHWDVDPRLSPFDSFMPLLEEELDTSNGEILIRACQKILITQVAGYRSRLKTVKIVFHSQDSMEFCYSDTTNLTFDVIDCSCLADNVGLVNLIVGSSRKLADTPEAVLLIESSNWNILGTTALEYVEEALCSPLSMIPTFYGLRLKNHIELESSEPTFTCYVGYPIKLWWRKALPFRNVVPNPSPELSRWFEQLAKKCFIVGKGWTHQFSMDKPAKPCGMLSYTPLTFSYAVNSLIQRVGVDCFKDTDKLKLPSIFKLTWRTFEAWKNKEIVLKFSTVLKGDPLHNCLLQKLIEMTDAPVFRLMLIPKSEVKDCYDRCYSQILSPERSWLTIPDAHVIENFGIDLRKTQDGNIDKIVVTFLLLSNHGIENTHCAVLFELNRGAPFVHSGLVSGMRVTTYDQSFPWNLTVPPLPTLSGVRMDAISCIEDPYQYVVEITVECVGNISGLNVSTNQCLPCESIHDITISLSQPRNIKPLALSFPHPILVDGINATLRRNDRSIKLVLKKALWEPWPDEFQLDHCKLNADCLKPWEKGFKLLLSHLLGTVVPIFSPPSKMLALIKVREMIVSFFLNFVKRTPNGQEYFRIQTAGTMRSPDWYIRIHFPYRITPLGAPLLILSAVDKRLTESLIQQRKLEKSRADEDLLRIWESPRCKKKSNPLTLYVRTPQEAQLLRLVLRLNSTKMTPTAWQLKNLPLGNNSPWLATFVSPLYQDSPLNLDYVTDKVSSSAIRYCSGEEVNSRYRCAACLTISQDLKRCARCRQIFYCNAECQRGDWARHKSACSKQ